MTIVGGLRARFIFDSVHEMLEQALTDLGWFDAGRQHKDLHFYDEPQDWDEGIEWNALVLSAEDVDDEDAEMGSNLTNDTWTYYVDLFLESEALGKHLTHDLRDILRGKMPEIGRDTRRVSVYDYSQPTPPEIFVCDIESVVYDRARDAGRPWQKYWFVLRFDVVDTYSDSGEVDEV